MNFQVEIKIPEIKGIDINLPFNFSFYFLEVIKHMVLKAKKLFDENGVLTSPQKKRGKALSSQTKSLARTFYMRDDVSRLMPGSKSRTETINVV